MCPQIRRPSRKPRRGHFLIHADSQKRLQQRKPQGAGRRQKPGRCGWRGFGSSETGGDYTNPGIKPALPYPTTPAKLGRGREAGPQKARCVRFRPRHPKGGLRSAGLCFGLLPACGVFPICSSLLPSRMVFRRAGGQAGQGRQRAGVPRAGCEREFLRFKRGCRFEIL